MAEIQAPEWLQKFGTLLGGYGAILATLVSLNAIFGQWSVLANGLALVVAAGMWTVVWIILRLPPPRNSSDKFGICVSVETEDDRMRSRLENDIVRRLNDLLVEHKLDDLIATVVATNNQAKLYNPFLTAHRVKIATYKEKDPPEPVPTEVYKPFDRFQKRTKCHFFIWGSLIERQEAILGGQPGYNLSTDALVIHSDLLPHQQKILSQQFLRWLRQIRIDRRMENPGLQFTADNVYIMTNLVIGSAAAMVGNVSAGYALHEPLLKHLDANDPNPHHQAIRKDVVRMVADECQFLGRINIDGDPEVARDFLSKALELKPKHYNSLLCRAILEYTVDKDIAAAKLSIDLAKTNSQGDGAWRYSKAFLEIAEGNYKDALRTYREITKENFKFENYVLSQVLDFNKELANKGFVPSHFILGYLVYKKLKNLPQALAEFEEFLKRAEDDCPYKLLVSRALEYRDELLQQMG